VTRYPQAGAGKPVLWGLRIKRILRSRLPERLSGRLPPIVVEIAIGVAMAGLMTLLRIAMLPVTGERAPYAFVFVAVLGSAVLAGWRSGLIALALGQWLAWTWIVGVPGAGADGDQLVGGLVVSTIAELAALAIITLYQREVERAWSRREEQVDLVHNALAEIDHRTNNNYQTVMALVLAQSKQADPPVKQALQQVVDRINAIAMASKQLALSSDTLERVRAGHHLGELCGEIRQGLSRPGIAIECGFDDIELGPDQTTWISILVNELVTNALKHAFPADREGAIRVALRRSPGGIELTVEDDGIGLNDIARTRSTGLGTRLVETFVKQLRARHEVSSDAQGTRHRIRIPPDPASSAPRF
jgi:two-component sensor histidine kinase